MKGLKDMSFEEIYEAYFTRVYRYALRLCDGDAHGAEELTSDTFFKAMKALDGFRGECDIFSWLCGIAKNSRLSAVRGEKPSEPLDEAEGETAREAPFPEMLEDAETAMLLHERLHALEEPYKEVFTLRVFGELSFKQIAHIFGKTENWACVTYHRARNKLREKTDGE